MAKASINTEQQALTFILIFLLPLILSGFASLLQAVTTQLFNILDWSTSGFRLGTIPSNTARRKFLYDHNPLLPYGYKSKPARRPTGEPTTMPPFTQLCLTSFHWV
jgi:hypothetical protein